MAQRKADLLEELSRLTREQLVERLVRLSCPAGGAARPMRKRKARPMDFDAYAKQHVAMKVAYLGWPFHGYASQISFKAASAHSGPGDPEQMSGLPTVEVCRVGPLFS
jgi:hypothetical protein